MKVGNVKIAKNTTSCLRIGGIFMLYKPNWSEVKETYKAWWNKELDYPLLQLTSPKEGTEYPDYDGWEFLRHRDCPEKAIDLFEEACKSTYFGAEAFPNLWANLGPGSLASYFTGFLRFDEKNNTAWFECPRSWGEVEKLEFRENNEWWEYTKYIVELSVKRGKGKFIVGTTDIGGVLDVLSSFRGAQNLLVDLIEEPARVLYMSEKILEAWFKVYKNLYSIIREHQEGTSAWMGIWCPERWYPLQCDFSSMISPKMFERFVAPHLEKQCKWLDYSIYHLDGPGEIPHLDILLDIPELTGIQWVPGDGNPQCDCPEWFPIYEKILARNKLLVLQTFDNKNNIPKIVEEIGGRGVLISAHLDDESNIKEFIKQIRNKSRKNNRGAIGGN